MTDKVHTHQAMKNACHLSGVVAMTQLRAQALAAIDELANKYDQNLDMGESMQGVGTCPYDAGMVRAANEIRAAVDAATRSIPSTHSEEP